MVRILALLLVVMSFGITVAVAQPDANQIVASDSSIRLPQGDIKLHAVKPGVDYAYIQSSNSRYFTFPAEDYRNYFATTFRGDKIPYIGAMAIVTAFLVDVDQEITSDAQRFADDIGLKHTNKQKPVVNWSVKVGSKAIGVPLNFPQDLESGMYFLGDGIVHSSIAVGLWGYGKAAGDERAIQTGTQCIEAILCTGFAIQVLKHSFGRESPQAATQPGGKWRLFPDPVQYQLHTPNYDAMPSGHIATAMTTVTVIADNYPDKKWIRPVGYSLMGVLMYAMLNNGVHWASDYPLGISIGYTFAKIIDSRSRTMLSAAGSNENPPRRESRLRNVGILPYFGTNSAGLSATYQF